MKFNNIELIFTPLGLTAAAVFAAAALTACGGDSPATAVPQAASSARQVRVAAVAETQAARLFSASGTLAAEEQMVLGTKSRRPIG